MEKAAKAKVATAVAEYIRLFPTEYQAFCDWSAQVRKDQKDKFARAPKGVDAIERKLGEIPEQLYNALVQLLTLEERNWFLAQGTHMGDFRGPYWFYKKYPMFAVTVV